MIVRRSQFRDAYERIRKAAGASGGSCAVLILVALDPDAVCACKMLSSLLKGDFIPHKVHPIAGWADLQRADDKLVKDQEDLRFVVLLNFGAYFDPAQYLHVAEDAKIYVIDSHKPAMLENCYLESSVVVWDDGEIERNGDVEKSFWAWHEEEERRQAAQSDDEEGEEDGAADDAAERASDDDGEEADRTPDSDSRKRRSRSPETDDEEEDPYDSDRARRRKLDRETHAPPSPRKRLLDRRREHLRHGDVLSAYYDQGDWVGESVACLMYSLASDLGRENNDLVWQAVVGFTSLSTRGQIADDDYNLYYGTFKDEVRRLNPPPLALNGRSANSTQTVTSSDNSIRTEDEFRFMLFRHWSLYDSMLHSPYLSSKLKMYTEVGRRQLHKLFAKMGFSLAQCRQVYTHMDMDLKRALREKLLKFAPGYGLDDIMIKSFLRRYGYRCTLSASDTAYAIQALLEAGNNEVMLESNAVAKAKLVTRSRPTDSAAVAASDAADARDALAGPSSEELIRNFYQAYDALDDVEGVLAAIPLSMELQRAVVRTGTALIEKREVRSLRSFRMAVVKEGPDMRLFTHPLALAKLAHWIAAAVDELERERGKHKHLPFVVAALDERRDRYVVLGTAVSPSTRDGANGAAAGSAAGDAGGEGRKGAPRNRFGNAFQQLSGSHQARFRLDSFDAAVVECDRADLGQLLETLSLQTLS